MSANRTRRTDANRTRRMGGPGAADVRFTLSALSVLFALFAAWFLRYGDMKWGGRPAYHGGRLSRARVRRKARRRRGGGRGRLHRANPRSKREWGWRDSPSHPCSCSYPCANSAGSAKAWRSRGGVSGLRWVVRASRHSLHGWQMGGADISDSRRERRPRVHPRARLRADSGARRDSDSRRRAATVQPGFPARPACGSMKRTTSPTPASSRAIRGGFPFTSRQPTCLPCS